MSNQPTQRSPEGGHWYTVTGEAMHFVPKKDGSGNRPTTLADARKLNLLPSVTTVLRILNKPALIDWMIRQAVYAVTTAPDIAGENLDSKITRVLETERQQDEESQKARDLGTDMHNGLEALFSGERIDDELRPWIEPAYVELRPRSISHHAEITIVGFGFGGRVDLVQETPESWMITDFKTTKRLPKSAWPEARLQLAAYAKIWQNSHPEKPVRVQNVYISTQDCGSFVVHETENWQREYNEGFAPLVKVWQHLNQYYPKQNGSAE